MPKHIWVFEACQRFWQKLQVWDIFLHQVVKGGWFPASSRLTRTEILKVADFISDVKTCTCLYERAWLRHLLWPTFSGLFRATRSLCLRNAKHIVHKQSGCSIWKSCSSQPRSLLLSFVWAVAELKTRLPCLLPKNLKNCCRTFSIRKSCFFQTVKYNVVLTMKK